MKLTFSPHARKRLFERNINPTTVRRIIGTPDSRLETFDGRIVVQGKDGDRLLRFVYVTMKPNQHHVVTVIIV
jgi:hypothetical protein